jgi:HTH-type transcriptional regulator / antitoxin HigA
MSTRVPAEVFPPGEFIRDEIEARGWTQTDLAEVLGRPFRLVNEILQGKRAITPETARGLGEAFGTGAELWMNLESAYRLSLAEPADEAVARRAKLYAKAPIKDMIRRGWLAETDDVDDLERQVLQFFELSSIDETPRLAAAARKATDYRVNTPPQWAWFYRAKQMAEAIEVGPFDHRTFSQALPLLGKLAGTAGGAGLVARKLAALGIRFVIVEHLPKTKLDGAAFWLERSAPSPVVALSLRFDRDDAFWFTLWHELGHIHHQDGLSIDDGLMGDAGSAPVAGSTEVERLADSFAANALIPPGRLDAFIGSTRPHFTKTRIIQFAQSVPVYPGIVLGQLQRRDVVSYASHRELLQKVRDVVTKHAPTDGWGVDSKVR